MSVKQNATNSGARLISAYIPPALHERVSVAARDSGRSVASEIRMLLTRTYTSAEPRS